MLVEDRLVQRLRFVAHEAVSPIVERIAELLRSGDRLEFAGDRIEAEVVVIDRNRLGVGAVAGADLAAVPGRRTIDLVIESPLQIVQHRLLIRGAEAGKDLSLDVGFVVAVGVFQVPDVGRSGDERAPLSTRDAARPQEMIGEDA